MTEFEKIIAEIEALDAEFRDHGIPERYKKKWAMNVNVGLWIAGRQTAEWLYAQTLEEKPARILELGTSVGYSALWLGKAAATYGGNVKTIEREKYKVDEAREYFARAKLGTTISCIHSNILDFLSTAAKKQTTYYNFVFIDAGKREYAEYLKLLEPILAPSAIIVADNMNDFSEHTKGYRAYIEKNRAYRNEKIEIGHGLMISKYKKHT